MRLMIILASAVVLGACTSGAVSGTSARTASAPAPRGPAPSRPPAVMNEAGLEAIMGKGASALTRRFGTARLDGTEGDVRKLQFVSDRCVLDIYLYPLRSGQAPVATHVEARERQRGAAINRSLCADEIARGARQ